MDIAKLVRILKICNSFSIQEADSQRQPFIIAFLFRKLIVSHL